MIKSSSSFNYILNYGLEFLKSNSIENPKKEIEIFLCQLLSCSKFELYNREEKSISFVKVNLLKEWLDRRAKREPIQYIINNAKRELYEHNKPRIHMNQRKKTKKKKGSKKITITLYFIIILIGKKTR